MSDPAAFPPIRKDRVCLIVLMAKKSGLTDEEFSKYWHEVHGPLFASLEIVKKNITLYEQVRPWSLLFVHQCPPTCRNLLLSHLLGHHTLVLYAFLLAV